MFCRNRFVPLLKWIERMHLTYVSSRASKNCADSIFLAPSRRKMRAIGSVLITGRHDCSLARGISTIVGFISKQLWSRMRNEVLSRNSPSDVLQRLISSNVDPLHTLSFCTWSQNGLNHSHPLDLTFKKLYNLYVRGKHNKIIRFLRTFVNREEASISSMFHAMATCSNSLSANSKMADMVVLAYVLNKNTNLALEGFKRAQEYGFHLSSDACNPLLRSLSKTNRIRPMQYVYKVMIGRKIVPDLCTYNIVISGLCRASKLSSAINVFKDMNVVGIKPDEATFNSLIYGHCKLNKSVKMYRVGLLLKEMKEMGILPNAVTYNILIDSYCRDGNVSAAVKLLEEMEKQGIKSTIATFNILIQKMLSDGKIEAALALRNQMTEAGYTPGMITYNTFLKGLCDNNMVKEAIELFDEMDEKKVDRSDITYNIILHAYCKQGKVKEAYSLLRSMIERGVSPSSGTYNCFITSLCEAGDMEGVSALLKEMEEKKLACVVTYNILIKAYCNRKETRRGEELMEMMKKNGVVPSSITYSTLMGGYFSEGKVMEALKLRSRMSMTGRKMNAANYNVVVKGLCENGKLEEANAALNEMLENGLAPNEVTYDCVKEHMIEKGFVPDIDGHLFPSSSSS